MEKSILERIINDVKNVICDVKKETEEAKLLADKVLESGEILCMSEEGGLNEARHLGGEYYSQIKRDKDLNVSHINIYKSKNLKFDLPFAYSGKVDESTYIGFDNEGEINQVAHEKNGKFHNENKGLVSIALNHEIIGYCFKYGFDGLIHNNRGIAEMRLHSKKEYLKLVNALEEEIDINAWGIKQKSDGRKGYRLMNPNAGISLDLDYCLYGKWVSLDQFEQHRIREEQIKVGTMSSIAEAMDKLGKAYTKESDGPSRVN